MEAATRSRICIRPHKASQDTYLTPRSPAVKCSVRDKCFSYTGEHYSRKPQTAGVAAPLHEQGHRGTRKFKRPQAHARCLCSVGLNFTCPRGPGTGLSQCWAPGGLPGTVGHFCLWSQSVTHHHCQRGKGDLEEPKAHRCDVSQGGLSPALPDSHRGHSGFHLCVPCHGQRAEAFPGRKHSGFVFPRS